MDKLTKKIEELKELMIKCNVTHIEINKYSRPDRRTDEIINKFETSIHQDDQNKPFGCARTYDRYFGRE